jgi:hypothetical protein
MARGRAGPRSGRGDPRAGPPGASSRAVRPQGSADGAPYSGRRGRRQGARRRSRRRDRRGRARRSGGDQQLESGGGRRVSGRHRGRRRAGCGQPSRHRARVRTPPGGGEPGAVPVRLRSCDGGGYRRFRPGQGHGGPGDVNDVRRARRYGQPRSVGRSRRRPRGRRDKRRWAHPGDRPFEPTWTEHLPGRPWQVGRRPPLSSALVSCPEVAVPPTTATCLPDHPVRDGAAAPAWGSSSSHW